jgi:hypothetical protein
MSALSLREAASTWRLGRETLNKAIKSGKLSLTTDKQIDPAEMLRVFGEPRPVLKSEPRPPKTTLETSGLEAEIAGLKATLAGLEAAVSGKDEIIAAKDEVIAALKQTNLLLTHEHPSSPRRRRWWPW